MGIYSDIESIMSGQRRKETMDAEKKRAALERAKGNGHPVELALKNGENGERKFWGVVYGFGEEDSVIVQPYDSNGNTGEGITIPLKDIESVKIEPVYPGEKEEEA